MISDDDLYSLAIALGSVAVILIVIYHFFEVNSHEGGVSTTGKGTKPLVASK